MWEGSKTFSTRGSGAKPFPHMGGEPGNEATADILAIRFTKKGPDVLGKQKYLYQLFLPYAMFI